MKAAAAFSSTHPDTSSHAETLRQIALIDPKEAAALHTIAKSVLRRLRSERQVLRLAPRA